MSNQQTSQVINNHEECKVTISAVHDAMYVLSGKWTLNLITALSFGARRYSYLLKNVNGISGRMLSKELKNLEINHLVKRTIIDSKPIAVEYELTTYGASLHPVILKLAEWGINHRNKIKSMYDK